MESIQAQTASRKSFFSYLGASVCVPILLVLVASFPLLMSSVSRAADVDPCKLVDSAVASQLLGSLAGKGHIWKGVWDQLYEMSATHCSYGVQGPPHMLLTVSVLEFKSVEKAKGWMVKAPKNTRGDTAQLKTTDASEIGEEGFCWSERHRIGCAARKTLRVIEIQVRGTGAPFRGSPGLQVTPELTSRTRETVKRAITKL